MLKRTDAITNEVLEPIAFVLAYPTVVYFQGRHHNCLTGAEQYIRRRYKFCGKRKKCVLVSCFCLSEN